MVKDFYKTILFVAIFGMTIVSLQAQTEIRTVDDLRNIKNNFAGSYMLMNDIDFADVTDWLPIGVTASTLANPGDALNFTGTFNGQGYKLKNITVNNPDKCFTGALFVKIGKADGSATVKNLVLENVNITGGNITGGLTGTVFSNLAGASVTIQNVSVSGTITGLAEVGGITGRCNNAIPILFQDCSVDAVITALDAASNFGNIANDASAVNIGGIVGSAFNGQNVTIKNCLVQGQMQTNSAIGNKLNQGGLIGLANSALAVITLNNSVVAAELFGDGGTKAFWGSNEAKLPANPGISTINVNSCYALAGNLTTQDGGALKPVADLQSEAFYKTTLLWDFDNVWQISKSEEYPTLKIEANKTGISAVKADQPWKITGSGNQIEVTVSEPLFLSVYDLAGKTLFAGQVNNQVSIPASKGIYILKLNSAGKTTVEKIIVK